MYKNILYGVFIMITILDVKLL